MFHSEDIYLSIKKKSDLKNKREKLEMMNWWCGWFFFFEMIDLMGASWKI